MDRQRSICLSSYFCLNFFVLLRSIAIIIIPASQSQYFEKSSPLLHFFSDGKELMFSTLLPSLSSLYYWFAAEGFSVFLQPSHLQASEHPTPELKHSQYRLRQPDFLQLQRFQARLQLLSPPSLTAILACATSSLNSPVFLHPTQAQSSPQSFPEEKHSQYIFRQSVFLQVQPMRFFLAELVEVGTKEILSPNESSSCCCGEWSRGIYMFSREEWMGRALMVFIIFRLWLISGNWSSEGRLKKEFLLSLGSMPSNNFNQCHGGEEHLPEGKSSRRGGKSQGQERQVVGS